jgi:hypothetical protein
VTRAASEAGRAFPAGATVARRAVNGRRCATDEQSQCRVVRARLFALAERLGVDRSEHRTTTRVDQSDDDLHAARPVKYDPVESGTDAGDAHEVTYDDGLHRPELIALEPTDCARNQGSARAAVSIRRFRPSTVE